MKLKLKEFTKRYRKLIIILVLPAIPILIYILFYFPAKKKYSKLAGEYTKYNIILTESGMIYNRMPKDFSLINRLSQLEQMFPQNDSESINNISRLCYKLNIDLASISPLKKEIALDANKRPIVLGERKLTKSVFKLSLRSNFINLIRFIEETRESKSLFVLNSLEITKTDPLATESDSLKVELELATYNLSKIDI